MGKNVDYNTQKFGKYLSGLEEFLPISSEYDNKYGQENANWWKNQREHMEVWFKSQNSLGEGNYKRNKPNTSSRITYNRLNCPGALLWIAEALNEEKDILEKAKNAAINEPNKRKRSSVIRGFITWERIVELCENRDTQL